MSQLGQDTLRFSGKASTESHARYKAQGTHVREITPLQEGAPTAAFL